MNRTLTFLAGIAVAASILATTAAPLTAAPRAVPVVGSTPSDVINVAHRDRFERRSGVVYLNGNRGYRNYRRGYRQHNGFWFPASAFIGGVIIGSIINGNPPVVRSGNAHIRWCQDRYRSYRASSNTFQPYNGPRQICYSPYD